MLGVGVDMASRAQGFRAHGFELRICRAHGALDLQRLGFRA